MKPPENLHTVDVRFNDTPGVIAVYVIRHAEGALLIDCGPTKTVPTLIQGLAELGLRPQDVTDVLLTHIHLDHAGAAGWWAQQGAQIHVHPIGAPHLLDPEKLRASTQRVYEQDPDIVFGPLFPVPQARLRVPADGDVVGLGGCRLTALNTPGHAEHHYAYLYENVCFSGDIGGVRLGHSGYVMPPTPPPEIHFGRWRESIARLQSAKFEYLAPTHYGLNDAPARQLETLSRELDAIERWTEQAMADDPPRLEFRERFREFQHELERREGLARADGVLYANLVNSNMGADGVYRYWKKFRMPQDTAVSKS